LPFESNLKGTQVFEHYAARGTFITDVRELLLRTFRPRLQFFGMRELYSALAR